MENRNRQNAEPQETEGQKRKSPWEGKRRTGAALLCLCAANLILAAAVFALSGRSRNLEHQIEELKTSLWGMENDITGTIQAVSQGIRDGQEQAASFIDSFEVRITPAGGMMAELEFTLDLKEYTDETEVYFIWESEEETRRIPAAHLEGTRFEAVAEIPSLTAGGSVKVCREEGGRIQGETAEELFSPREACYLGMGAYGSIGWTTRMGKQEVKIEPEAELFIESIPEGVAFSRAEAQLYINRELISSTELHWIGERGDGGGDGLAANASGGCLFASWEQEEELTAGDQIDLRIVAEDSLGSVYSAIAARGRVVSEDYRTPIISDEAADGNLHVEPSGQAAWTLLPAAGEQ